MFDESKFFGGGSELSKTPPQETPQGLGEEDKTKEEIDEAGIKIREEAELTEEAEKKAEEVFVLCEAANEELDKEKEELSGDKRKIFEGFAEKAKEGFKKAGHYLKDIIKDYRYSEIGTGISVSAFIASAKMVENSYGDMTLSIGIAYSICLGAEILALRALFDEHEKRHKIRKES